MTDTPETPDQPVGPTPAEIAALEEAARKAGEAHMHETCDGIVDTVLSRLKLDKVIAGDVKVTDIARKRLREALEVKVREEQGAGSLAFRQDAFANMRGLGAQVLELASHISGGRYSFNIQLIDNAAQNVAAVSDAARDSAQRNRFLSGPNGDVPL